nr:SRPBCC domain-containing protein [Leucobacter exalbidus]
MRFTELDGAPLNVQTLTQSLPTSLDEVWAAVSRADRIAAWFLPLTGDLSLGGRYQFAGNAGGEVLECHPPVADSGESGESADTSETETSAPAARTAGYRVTWEMGGGATWLTVRLSSQGPAQTRFELEHAALAADVPADMWETFGPGATGVGWDGGLLGLSLHLGAVAGSLSPAEAEAWATTAEGQSFYRGAADHWAVAHVAAGASIEQAQRSADATFGFYTGQAPSA